MLTLKRKPIETVTTSALREEALRLVAAYRRAKEEALRGSGNKRAEASRLAMVKAAAAADAALKAAHMTWGEV